jgi:acyl dehydratase
VIRHFADGLGDTNPLWTDEEYAKRTKWGGIIAPPCFLYST